MKPAWLRTHAACPDCGFAVDYKLDKEDEDSLDKFLALKQLDKLHVLPSGRSIIVIKTASGIDIKEVAFDCPRCKSHFTSEDFWNYHRDKISHTITESQFKSDYFSGR